MNNQFKNQVNLPLIVGISTRAMFNLEEEHRIFQTEGVDAYSKFQLENERRPLAEGAAFEVTRRLLALNPPNEPRLVDFVLLSQNSPDLSLRAFNSFKYHDIPIQRGSFTSGRPVAPFAKAWNVDLFLSNDRADVEAAAEAGIAAARLGPPPPPQEVGPNNEVHFAFDGDAVIFSAESDEIYKHKGLEYFLKYESENAHAPMECGPFGKTFLPKLALLRQKFMRPEGRSRVRITIVTARNAPAHERVIRTLRAWGTPADEAHFVGAQQKAPILSATGAHIFFDDQERHVDGAAGVVSAGLVPGPHDAANPVIPAG